MINIVKIESESNGKTINVYTDWNKNIGFVFQTSDIVNKDDLLSKVQARITELESKEKEKTDNLNKIKSWNLGVEVKVI